MTSQERLSLLRRGFWVNKFGNTLLLSEVGERWLLNVLRKLDIYRSGNSQSRTDVDEMYLLVLAECRKRRLVADKPVNHCRCYCGKAGLYTVRVMLRGKLERSFFCKEHRSEAVALQEAVAANRDAGKALREQYRKEFDSDQSNLSSLKKTSKFGRGSKRRR